MTSYNRPEYDRSRISRRALLTGLTAGVAGTVGKVVWNAYQPQLPPAVFVGRAPNYDADLGGVIRRGLEEIGLSPRVVRGLAILLKLNLIEPALPSQGATTHPLMLHAVADIFLSWGVRDVTIGEGSGHCRDCELLLEVCGLKPVLKELRLPFIDLNQDDTITQANSLGLTGLKHFVLPQTVVNADMVVLLGKMKTHHWTGVTLSMKSCFGLLPGVYYGWPKNVLHFKGLTESILDITATVRPHLAIIDGIIGMEGDGPIMGTPKFANAIVIGANLAAADATAARLMGIDPLSVDHLRRAVATIGPIEISAIEQRGEAVARMQTVFQLPDNFMTESPQEGPNLVNHG